MQQTIKCNKICFQVNDKWQNIKFYKIEKKQ